MPGTIPKAWCLLESATTILTRDGLQKLLNCVAEYQIPWPQYFKTIETYPGPGASGEYRPFSS